MNKSTPSYLHLTPRRSSSLLKQLCQGQIVLFHMDQQSTNHVKGNSHMSTNILSEYLLLEILHTHLELFS
jgi:hypothetical protein